MQRYAQRTMNGFYCDCNESRDAWHMFFRTIQVISHKIGTKSDRIRLTLNFDEEVGFSLGLSHPALHRHAPLLWGFPNPVQSIGPAVDPGSLDAAGRGSGTAGGVVSQRAERVRRDGVEFQ